MDTAPSFEVLAATALAGLVWEASKAYRQACPPLPELRSAPANDPTMLQRLIDADVTVGIPVVLAGAVATVVMRSPWPLVVVLLALAGVAGYHHSILHDPT